MAIEDDLAERGYSPVQEQAVAKMIIESEIPHEMTDSEGTRWYLERATISVPAGRRVVWVETWVLEVLAEIKRVAIDERTGQVTGLESLRGIKTEDHLRALDVAYRGGGTRGLLAALAAVRRGEM
jgi:hypothetical protein